VASGKSEPTPTTAAPAAVTAETFVPRVKLTPPQQKILQFMRELNLDADGVRETLLDETGAPRIHRVDNADVVFSEMQIQGILQNPSEYGFL